MAETTLQLQWTDNSNRESGFLVQRKLGAGAYSQIAQVDAGRNPEPSPVQYTDTGLVEGSTYTYRVKAVNAGGESAYGNEATGITLPSAPVSLAALDISGTEIDLTWTNTSGGATSVKIERKLGAGAYSQIATVGAAVASYADNGVTAGNTYTYRVRASNAGGDGAYSNEASATTASSGAPLDKFFWLKSDTIVGVANGGRPALWLDSSGNGRDTSQANAAKKPYYFTGEVNGLPAVYVPPAFFGLFDLATAVESITAGKSWTLFMLVSPDPNGSFSNSSLGIFSSDDSNDLTINSVFDYDFADFPVGDTYIRIIWDAAGDGGQNYWGPITPSTPQVWALICDKVAQTITVKVNGSVIAETAVFGNPGFPASGISFKQLQISGTADRVVEAFGYDRVLTTDEIAASNAYLATRGGL